MRGREKSRPLTIRRRVLGQGAPFLCNLYSFSDFLLESLSILTIDIYPGM